ncbi:hypothetical protein RJZ56_001618 [Blastomyces dermatitidis]|uniref:Rhodopsin domain-containing protein n=2 Tax=Blastomyces TaxID=229219 RepID=A0A179US43_BLAGS|nr:uncharacterized protein BDBG_06704 [Blastomyces gilchristii SLH14081]XP_031579583.1 hypothetical protein, variant [Blastomyces gilchristii SLH14081]EGE78868.1 hypothetical protein BDDG_01805 [Blastomyces dermatitidis ATCC 18188]KMW66831.1 hypothetical protein, variant [Blastomyces dermatitidis ATCC 18188]OAT10934.1 hypothetical protein BDBG_06704 [Blastomyces gilchristii SLH14081]OAT10935.1 hypothetical protein, variant [Blastomyces gilchristii SLH14081]
MAAAKPLPPGISEPLAVDTSNDHSGFIAIITALFLGYALVSLGIRAYVRHSRHVVKTDDYVLLVAMVLFCIQSSVVFVQIGNGWGKSRELLTPRPHIALLKATYAADMLYVLTHCVSKCSAALFYLRISPGRSHIFMAWGLVGLSVIWAVISMILISLGCDHSRPWTDISSKCAGVFPRWQFIGAFDIITEIGLSSVPFFLVAGIQMHASRKIVVVLAFSSRLLVTIPSAFHIHYVKRMLDSSDYTLVGSYATISLQLELSYGIMANTIPCLKPFMAAYEATGTPSYTSRIHSHGRSQSNSGNSKGTRSRYIRDSTLALSTIPSVKFNNRRVSNASTVAQKDAPQPPRPLLLQKYSSRNKQSQTSRANAISYATRLEPGSQELAGPSFRDDDSKRLIIKKDVNWNVECSKSAERKVDGSTPGTNAT